MDLFYYKKGNFGDELNAWLWPKLIPELDTARSDLTFCAIGTILDDALPQEEKIIFGSGAGYSTLSDATLEKASIYFVRGPLTAQKLNLSPEKAISDPGLLVSNFWEVERFAKKHPISYIPHHESLKEGYIIRLCETAGIKLIDPRQDVETVLTEMSQSELILAEAMHGAIIADTLRIPWVPIKLGSQILDFKWNDWCQSMHIPFAPLSWNRSLGYPFKLSAKNIPLLSSLAWNRFAKEFKKQALAQKPILSESERLNTVIQQMLDQVEKLNAFLASNK